MLHGVLCGAKLASRCCMEHCVEPRWQVDIVWSMSQASRCCCIVEPRWQVDVVWSLVLASRCHMEHCVEPRWQVDVVWSIVWSQGGK